MVILVIFDNLFYMVV